MILSSISRVTKYIMPVADWVHKITKLFFYLRDVNPFGLLPLDIISFVCLFLVIIKKIIL